MKLNEALQRAMITVKKYIDKVTPTKLSDLEIDIEVGTVKTINGNEPDENGNVEIQTGNPNALLFSEQNLTEEQKTQARANIGTIDAKAVDDALSLKADNISHEETVELLTETGFISPLTNANGDVYTNAKGDVYVL